MGCVQKPTRSASRIGCRPQGTRRQSRRFDRPPRSRRAERSQSRHNDLSPDRQKDRESDRRSRAALLPAQIHANLDHRLRFRGGAEVQGETGPCPQYSVRRASNIFAELGRPAEDLREDFNRLSAEDIAKYFSGESGDYLWSLVYFASRLGDVAQLAANAFSLPHSGQIRFSTGRPIQCVLSGQTIHILKEADAKTKDRAFDGRRCGAAQVGTGVGAVE